MEFPDLGQHCSDSSCKQLDFLPMKCNACNKIFCNNHFSYTNHSCPESYKKDNQVPVCPMCNAPIPVPSGQTADIVVGRHIDNDCQSDLAKEKRNKIYTNRCSHKGCKTKELIPFNCENCRQNFCIRHRLELDHECKGFQGSGRGISQAGAAAASRQPFKAASKPASKPTSSSRPQQSVLSSVGRDLDRERRERMQQPRAAQPRSVNLRSMQANMTEDEALAQAMAASMSDSQPKPSNPPTREMTAQEAEDHALAQAIAESERLAAEQRRRGNQGGGQSKDKSCLLS